MPVRRQRRPRRVKRTGTPIGRTPNRPEGRDVTLPFSTSGSTALTPGRGGTDVVTTGAPSPETLGGSLVIQEPFYASSPLDEIIFTVSTVQDRIPQWGVSPAVRDKELRAFWPTEHILASSIYSMAAKYAAFEWDIRGPERMSNLVVDMLHGCQMGGGWIPFMLRILIDLFTQDNGAFAEILRMDNDPRSPVVSLNHLDSARCIRTGRWEEPVVYQDLKGSFHRMKWYQVVTFEELPLPIETARGMQLCAVSRILSASRIVKDVTQYEAEKVSGQFTRAIHLVSGVQQGTIQEVLEKQKMEMDAEGFFRYIQPAIVASLKPDARVTHELIEMASLPDHFDKESFMKWLIITLGLAFGVDSQEFAPLPAGNLGTSQQSQTLHMKGRAKGPTLFMEMIEHKFNYHGIMPASCSFAYDDQGLGEERERAELEFKRAQTRALRIKSGEITPEVARLQAVEEGDLKKEHIPIIEEAERVALEEQRRLNAQDAPTPQGTSGAQSQPKQPLASGTGAGGLG